MFYMNKNQTCFLWVSVFFLTAGFGSTAKPRSILPELNVYRFFSFGALPVSKVFPLVCREAEDGLNEIV